MPTSRSTLVALSLSLLAATAGCGTTASAPSAASRDAGGAVRVVASTDVYGDIAEAIGGEDVEVTSILTNPDADPHSFEANPRTALAISKADLLIENGGGYDDYMGRLRASTDSDAPVIDVVTLSGKKAPAGGELNEHVWYDFPTVAKLVATLADRFATLDPDGAADFEQRATAFTDRLDALEAREKALRASTRGKGIGITEPVPLYLTDALGLVDRTPEAFSEAVEEGDDVAASVLQQTLDLYTEKKVAALVYNEQTTGPVTQKVLAAAKASGVPVVPVTETLPKGEDYLTWMTRNLDAVATAVQR